MKVCRLCEQSNDFGKSHVLPEWMFAPLRDDTKSPLLVTDRSGVFPKRVPIGVYDQQILCKKCERHFDQWDNYGKIILLDKLNKIEPKQDDKGVRLQDVDVEKLRMFFISVLWRASISGLNFFKRISLGPFETQAKQRVLDRRPGPLGEFSIVLSKWDESWIKGFSDPYMSRIDGLNFAVIPMLNYMSYIKVDKQSYPSSLTPFIIGTETDLVVLLRDFSQSKDRKVLAGVAQKFWR